jgi:hypothetical protein
MLSQIVAREVRAELGRKNINRKAFAEMVNLPYKKALQMLEAARPWTLEDVESAATVLGVNPLDLLYPPASSEVAA